jgi:hypothetical protein
MPRMGTVGPLQEALSAVDQLVPTFDLFFPSRALDAEAHCGRVGPGNGRGHEQGCWGQDATGGARLNGADTASFPPTDDEHGCRDPRPRGLHHPRCKLLLTDRYHPLIISPYVGLHHLGRLLLRLLRSLWNPRGDAQGHCPYALVPQQYVVEQGSL